MADIDRSEHSILVIDDDERISMLIEVTLKQFGYSVYTAASGEVGLEKAKEYKPDLIVLDVMMPGMDGLEVCRRLKENNYTRYIPVIMLSAKGQLEDRLSGLAIGADDYIPKPFNIKELVAKVDSILNKNKERLDANPTTRLPGNFSIEREINKRIKSGKKFAFAYVDLDNFKAYNDKYGFYNGDKIIGFTSQVLLNVITEYGSVEDFVGHIGGDDFVFITEPDKIKVFCENIIKNFDNAIRKFYNSEDLKRGYIISRNRQGIVMEFPIMSISILIITNEKREITHPGQISDLEGELKGYVKSLEGSNYVVDKRRDSSPPKDYKDNVNIIWIDVKDNDVAKIHEEFKKQGYKVHFVDSSTAAIKLMSKIKPHIVLIGVNLHLLEAYNICNFLYSASELRRIPILMISRDNLFFKEGKVKKIKGNAVDYFTKKVDFSKLIYKINEVVEI